LARKNIYTELFQFCIIRQATLEEGLGYLREAQEIEGCIEPFKQNSWIRTTLVNVHTRAGPIILGEGKG
jgi:hypothetical protein